MQHHLTGICWWTLCAVHPHRTALLEPQRGHQTRRNMIWAEIWRERITCWAGPVCIRQLQCKNACKAKYSITITQHSLYHVAQWTDGRLASHRARPAVQQRRLAADICSIRVHVSCGGWFEYAMSRLTLLCSMSIEAWPHNNKYIMHAMSCQFKAVIMVKGHAFNDVRSLHNV